MPRGVEACLVCGVWPSQKRHFAREIHNLTFLERSMLFGGSHGRSIELSYQEEEQSCAGRRVLQTS